MHQNPFTPGGYDHQNLEQKIDRKADQSEIYSLRSSVDSLERSLREACSTIDGLRHRCERLEEVVREMSKGEYGL